MHSAAYVPCNTILFFAGSYARHDLHSTRSHPCVTNERSTWRAHSCSSIFDMVTS